jgi:hypothetical protein
MADKGEKNLAVVIEAPAEAIFTRRYLWAEV